MKFRDLSVGDYFTFDGSHDEWRKTSTRKYEAAGGDRNSTGWMDMRVGSINAKVQRTQHKFLPSTGNILYCLICGASETDHQL